MARRILFSTFMALVLVLASTVALTMPASAQVRHITVRLADGQIVNVTVDAAPGTPMEALDLPGVPLFESVAPGPEAAPPVPDPAAEGPSAEGAPVAPAGPVEDPDAPEPDTGTVTPSPREGKEQGGGGDDRKVRRPRKHRRQKDRVKDQGRDRGSRERRRPAPLRKPDGSPTRQNPTFFDALPGPSQVTAVPNFVIRKFRVPLFLLPIYQAAGIQYGVRWEILAAVNEIETDYGRNLNVSTAGALGWMQFMPATWRAYGVDANKDGRRDPYNPVDAIFAAARYLAASGAEKDIRGAIFAYNHADWYVDSVMMRARLIAGVPDDLVGSLTGLTEGRFPVYARASYADDLSDQDSERRVPAGTNAARVIEGSDRQDIDIYSRRGAPVVAVNDGVVKDMGRSKELGRYLVLQDVYGNQYTYSGLGEVARAYPAPRDEGVLDAILADARHANDARPTAPASAGRQPDPSRRPGRSPAKGENRPGPQAVQRERLFAHPQRPASRAAGGMQQLLKAGELSGLDAGLMPLSDLKGVERFRNYFSEPVSLDPKTMVLKRMRRGARVIGGTILGRVGQPDPSRAAHLEFAIRPGGKGAPSIDPKPILDGWKLLESTAIYRASGRNALYGEDGTSIGQVLLLPKPLLQRRVLNDERIDVGGCQRSDIAAGQIDRRVLATLAYLAESGLRPTVSSLRCGRETTLTSSGNVSHHSSGNAVDISMINGVPIMGNQEPGGVTEQAVRRLMRLQGTTAPAQIISLLDLGGATLAMGDHADHIHVGFRPLFGDNPRLGAQTLAVLQPGQWSDLLERLREIDNPAVPRKPSRFSLPVPRASRGNAAAGD